MAAARRCNPWLILRADRRSTALVAGYSTKSEDITIFTPGK